MVVLKVLRRRQVMGAAELMGGVSYAVGPPVGGLLFEYGGFAWPFVIQGCLPVLFSAGLQARAARRAARAPDSASLNEPRNAAGVARQQECSRGAYCGEHPDAGAAQHQYAYAALFRSRCCCWRTLALRSM